MTANIILKKLLKYFHLSCVLAILFTPPDPLSTFLPFALCPRSLEFTCTGFLAHRFPVATRQWGTPDLGEERESYQSIYSLFCFMWNHPRLALLMQVIILLKVICFTWQIYCLHVSFHLFMHIHTSILYLSTYLLIFTYIYWGSFVAN